MPILFAERGFPCTERGYNFLNADSSASAVQFYDFE